MIEGNAARSHVRYGEVSSARIEALTMRGRDDACAPRGRSLRDYRLYFLNSQARIVRSEVVSVLTDAEACAEAERLDHADAIEIWEGARKVALIDPRGSASAQ